MPSTSTGAAVDMVSVIGYTPDIFVGPIMGRLLDASPGIDGHRHVFQLFMSFACLGLAATLGLRRLNRAQVTPAVAGR